MYTDYFGLKESPFDLTPSPRFVYLGQTHKEALATLTSGVTERKGLSVLTGGVGSGKTTVVKKLLQDLDATSHHVYLSNPLLSPDEFVEYLTFVAFKRKVHFKSRSAFLLAFERFLLRCRQERRHFILIVDESHKLSFELLEEIDRLSRLENGGEKLMSVLLVGQTEINEKLADPRCRALHRQIQNRCHLSPLNLVGTNEYVKRRLGMAGARQGSRIFSEDAIDAIYKYSYGYPRIINRLAESALLLGYAERTGEIGGNLIRKITEDMSLEGKPPGFEAEISGSEEARAGGRASIRPFWKWAPIVILAMITMVLAAPGQIAKDSVHSSAGPVAVSVEPRSEGPVGNSGIARQRIVGTLEAGHRIEPALQQARAEIRSEEEREVEQGAGAQERPPDVAQAAGPGVAPKDSQEEITRPVGSLEVTEAVICRDVVDRAPVGTGDRFPSTVNSLHCFTRIASTREAPAKITHLWYFRDQEMARIALQVRSQDWRTNSSKTILSSEVGPWHVDVLDPEGRVLTRLKFEVFP
jgi:general secretion pathway protein A